MIKIFIQTMIEYRPLFRVNLLFSVLILVLAAFLSLSYDRLFLGVWFFYYNFMTTFNYFFWFLMFVGVMLSLFVYLRTVKFKNVKFMDVLDHIDHFLQSYILQNVPRALAVFICMFGMSLFFVGKATVGVIGDFYADPYLIKLEKFVHFGDIPNSLIPDGFYTHSIVSLSSKIYLFWFSIKFFFFFYAILFEKSKLLAAQVVWSYFLCWTVLGVACAFLLSSAGPLFLDLKYPELAEIYQPFLDKFIGLQEANNTKYYFMGAKDSMGGAWLSRDLLGKFTISAMPSLHIAIAWINVLQARRIHPFLGIATFIYAMVILFCSVFLLWHYAIDGYVSIIGASIIWWGTGKILKKKYQDEL